MVAEKSDVRKWRNGGELKRRRVDVLTSFIRVPNLDVCIKIALPPRNGTKKNGRQMIRNDREVIVAFSKCQ